MSTGKQWLRTTQATPLGKPPTCTRISIANLQHNPSSPLAPIFCPVSHTSCAVPQQLAPSRELCAGALGTAVLNDMPSYTQEFSGKLLPVESQKSFENRSAVHSAVQFDGATTCGCECHGKQGSRDVLAQGEGRSGPEAANSTTAPFENDSSTKRKTRRGHNLWSMVWAMRSVQLFCVLIMSPTARWCTLPWHRSK
jgi:hypothetical protein